MSHMTNDPRSALNRLIAAFEAHLDAAATGDELSPAVVAAENALQDAFFTYDDALFTAAEEIARELDGAGDAVSPCPAVSPGSVPAPVSAGTSGRLNRR